MPVLSFTGESPFASFSASSCFFLFRIRARVHSWRCIVIPQCSSLVEHPREAQYFRSGLKLQNSSAYIGNEIILC
ncbi:hypothetical protein BD310DRAFT_714174 [Dichomitus squalens]|uniref:Uncharacterized protein n=1 Tax=Dichomitus squalens TaxID=114155 RepID=A0A4Q9PLM8_9APHY|nr:hypothetical protein BD310DRAFT_714174 [Dichomitus squalens]